jgi:hypothetical protein
MSGGRRGRRAARPSSASASYFEIQKQLGPELKKLFRKPSELPHRLFALLLQVTASEDKKTTAQRRTKSTRRRKRLNE